MLNVDALDGRFDDFHGRNGKDAIMRRGASNSLREASAHGLRRDKPARFSTNFQRDEKSFRP